MYHTTRPPIFGPLEIAGLKGDLATLTSPRQPGDGHCHETVGPLTADVESPLLDADDTDVESPLLDIADDMVQDVQNLEQDTDLLPEPVEDTRSDADLSGTDDLLELDSVNTDDDESDELRSPADVAPTSGVDGDAKEHAEETIPQALSFCNETLSQTCNS